MRGKRGREKGREGEREGRREGERRRRGKLVDTLGQG